MDSNPIAPFPMYVDEYILWMENFKNTHSQTITKTFDWVCIAMSGISIIFIVLAIIFKGDYKLLNAAAFLGVCAIITSLIIVFAMNVQQKRKPTITYYVTNYRLVELQEGNLQNIRFGYLQDLKSVKIDTYSNKPTFLEFEWSENTDKELITSGFYDIDNCREIYDIIAEYKQKLSESSIAFDFISQ